MNPRFLRTSGTVLIVMWIALCCNTGVAWSQEAPPGKATLQAQFYARHTERIKRLTHSRYSSPKLDEARDRFTIASMKKQWASAEKELDQWESVLGNEAKRLNKVDEFRKEHRVLFEEVSMLPNCRGVESSLQRLQKELDNEDYDSALRSLLQAKKEGQAFAERQNKVNEFRKDHSRLFAEVSMFPESHGVRTSLQRVQRALDNDDYDTALQSLLQAQKEGQSLIAAELEFRRKYKRSMDQVDEGPFNKATERARSDYKQAIAEFDFANASTALKKLDSLREQTRENRRSIEAVANEVLLNADGDILLDWRILEIKAEMVAELENEDWAAAKELVTRMLERKDNLLRLKRYE